MVHMKKRNKKKTNKKATATSKQKNKKMILHPHTTVKLKQGRVRLIALKLPVQITYHINNYQVMINNHS